MSLVNVGIKNDQPEPLTNYWLNTYIIYHIFPFTKSIHKKEWFNRLKTVRLFWGSILLAPYSGLCAWREPPVPTWTHRLQQKLVEWKGDGLWKRDFSNFWEIFGSNFVGTVIFRSMVFFVLGGNVELLLVDWKLWTGNHTNIINSSAYQLQIFHWIEGNEKVQSLYPFSPKL